MSGNSPRYNLKHKQIMTTLIKEFFGEWPFTTVTTTSNSSESSIDLRLKAFKRLSFEKMDSVIQDLTELLEEMKEVRKEKLSDEISKTEEYLKSLKEIH